MKLSLHDLSTKFSFFASYYCTFVAVFKKDGTHVAAATIRATRENNEKFPNHKNFPGFTFGRALAESRLFAHLTEFSNFTKINSRQKIHLPFYLYFFSSLLSLLCTHEKRFRSFFRVINRSIRDKIARKLSQSLLPPSAHYQRFAQQKL